MAKYWRRARKILVHKVLHTSDTPHAIALGAGIATFVAFLPLVGIQTIIAVALAAMVRANKVVCVPIVWITNPLTLVPIYGACFKLGQFALAGGATRDRAKVLSQLNLHGGLSLFDLAFWGNLFTRLMSLGKELWVGCAIVGLVLGIIAYGFTRWGVAAYRERRRRRLLRKSLLDPRLQHDTAVHHTEAA